MSETSGAAEGVHGIHIVGARLVATCMFHGLRASAPVGLDDRFVRAAWTKHLTKECLVPTIEERGQNLIDYEGEVTALVLPIELWRQVRASIEQANRRALTPPAPEPTTETSDERTA